MKNNHVQDLGKARKGTTNNIIFNKLVGDMTTKAFLFCRDPACSDRMATIEDTP